MTKTTILTADIIENYNQKWMLMEWNEKLSIDKYIFIVHIIWNYGNIILANHHSFSRLSEVWKEDDWPYCADVLATL